MLYGNGIEDEDGLRMMQIIISVQCLDDSCFCVLLFLMYYNY